MNGSTITILAGALIIIAGIALLGLQVMESKGNNIQEHDFKLINVEVGSYKLHVETGFLGAPLIILGMFLLVIGAIIQRVNRR